MKFDIHGGGCGHSCCLRVENMSVKIGTDRILKDVNLHVHCGEMVALIGPNGAGKTTSFYMMVGFIRPTSGQVFIDGKEYEVEHSVQQKYPLTRPVFQVRITRHPDSKVSLNLFKNIL